MKRRIREIHSTYFGSVPLTSCTPLALLEMITFITNCGPAEWEINPTLGPSMPCHVGHLSPNLFPFEGEIFNCIIGHPSRCPIISAEECIGC